MEESDSGEGVKGKDYRFALPSDEAANALYKVKIPADGEYAVYARWPDVPGLERFGVRRGRGSVRHAVDEG